MKTNRLLKTLLTSILTVSMLAGCSDTNSEIKKVAIIQLVEHTSLNTDRKSVV